VKPFSTLLLSLLLATALPAHAQDDSACPAGQLQPISAEAPADSMRKTTSDGTPMAKRSAVTDPRPAVSVSPTTDAEAVVQDRIEGDGLHVVHFWAPWCPNSENELANGWADLVANNPNVTFTFVTVWNDDETGTAVLNEYDLPDRVATVTQPDLGPSDNESNRRQSFLSHPVTWIPSTWIFHNNGELAFAMNYGEMEMGTIQSLLDATSAEW
jgi:thiol-disulfide isomerase/thioredoxin